AFVGFAPWSIFLCAASWQALGKRARSDTEPGSGVSGNERYRFLWCWIAVYILFFSLARTKLPNYILPVYAPVAVITARYLDRWRRQGTATIIREPKLAFVTLAFVGLGVGAFAFLTAGVIPVPIKDDFPLAKLTPLTMLGLPLLAGGGVGWCCLRRRKRSLAIAALVGAAVLFLGPLFAIGAPALNSFKAPREVVRSSGAFAPTEDIRAASYQYFQPSLVYYCGREVVRLNTEEEVQEFLRSPLKVYLFVPEQLWKRLQVHAPETARQLAIRPDMYRGC